MDPNFRRIEVVIRHFPELWGLQSIALGIWLLVLMVRRWVPALDWLQDSYGVLSYSFLIVIVLIPAYYTHRFGRLDWQERSRFWWMLWLGVTALMVDTLTTIRGVPSAFFFTIAAFSAWTVIRDWPVRTHRLVMASAALFASITFAHVTDDATRLAWGRQTLVLTAVALIVTGALDHRLLSRTLGGAPSTSDATAGEEVS